MYDSFLLLLRFSKVFDRQRPVCGVQMCTGVCCTYQVRNTSGVTSPSWLSANFD